jgi:hypothetical protein
MARFTTIMRFVADFDNLLIGLGRGVVVVRGTTAQSQTPRLVHHDCFALRCLSSTGNSQAAVEVWVVARTPVTPQGLRAPRHR